METSHSPRFVAHISNLQFPVWISLAARFFFRFFWIHFRDLYVFCGPSFICWPVDTWTYVWSWTTDAYGTQRGCLCAVWYLTSLCQRVRTLPHGCSFSSERVRTDRLQTSERSVPRPEGEDWVFRSVREGVISSKKKKSWCLLGCGSLCLKMLFLGSFVGLGLNLGWVGWSNEWILGEVFMEKRMQLLREKMKNLDQTWTMVFLVDSCSLYRPWITPVLCMNPCVFSFFYLQTQMWCLCIRPWQNNTSLVFVILPSSCWALKIILVLKRQGEKNNSRANMRKYLARCEMETVSYASPLTGRKTAKG